MDAPANDSSLLQPRSWRLVVLIAIPFWVSAGALRSLSARWSMATGESGSASAATWAEHATISAIAILLYLLGNAIVWRPGRRWSALLQHGVLGIAFALTVPVILLASQISAHFDASDTANYLITYWLGLAVILGVRNRIELHDAELAGRELQTAATRAHLFALRMQMNPHFAFNALNSIAALLERDPKRARKLLFSLSGLFQRTLAASRAEWHSLDDELLIAADYLHIQSERAAQPLEFEFVVDASTRRANIPSLLLQPLIENAVLHGVSGGNDRLRIWVYASLIGHRGGPERLRIEVGNSADTPVPMNRSADGMGQSNTRQRLLAAYGERASLYVARPDIGSYLAQLELPAVA